MSEVKAGSNQSVANARVVPAYAHKMHLREVSFIPSAIAFFCFFSDLLLIYLQNILNSVFPIISVMYSATNSAFPAVKRSAHPEISISDIFSSYCITHVIIKERRCCRGQKA